MRLITRGRLETFAKEHPDALEAWALVASQADWRSLADVRGQFPAADGVAVESGRVVTVFNVRGNRYRLITAIHYNTGVVYVMRFYTHAEYDRNAWKEQL